MRSMLAVRFWSLLFIVVAAAWWWVTRTHAGSWWWAAALNMVPPHLLLPLPLWLAWRASRLKKRGWVMLNLLSALLFTVSTVGFVLPRAARAQVSGVPLTVMTLNANYASASPARLAEVALREGVQVLTLQEALDKGGSAAAYEGALRAAFPGWTLVRHDELLTLSRLPILDSQVVNFPHTPHAVLLTHIRDEGQTATVVNTHLPTSGLLPNSSDRELGRGLPERMERGLKLRWDFQTLMAGLLKKNAGPFVLAGDLNTPARGGMVHQLRFLKLRDAFAEGGSGFGFTHYAVPLLGHSRIDYVWVRDVAVRQASVQRDLLSDHRAYVVRLVLPAPVEEGEGQ